MVAGHLREKKGNYYMVLSYKTREGANKTKMVATGLEVKNNKKRAEAMLRQARLDFNPEDLIGNEDMKFFKFLNQWLKESSTILKPDIYATYSNTIKTRIIPYFKKEDVKLINLTNNDLTKYFNYEKDINHATTDELQEYHKIITTALDYAVQLDWLKNNPVESANLPVEETPILFTDFILEWLEIIRNKVELSTYGSYENKIKGNIVPYFIKMQLTLKDLESNPKHIQDYYQAQLDAGRSANTVIHFHANIRKCLQYAFQLGLIQTNPADRVEKPRKEKYIAKVYNQQELDLLFAKSKGIKLELSIILAAFYGLRRSEIVGLRWESIDFKKKTITINHVVTQATVNGKFILIPKNRTKTKSSHRTLPLVGPFEKLLLKLKESQKENRRACGTSYCQEYNEYLYVDQIGKLIKPDYITVNFPKLLNNNGLKKIRFHDLRHSCASLLYANGVSLKEIQEWLGHSDIATTTNIYTHLDYSSKMSSANAIIGVFPTSD